MCWLLVTWDTRLMVSFQNSYLPRTFFGNRVFVDILSYVKMISYWIKMGPKSNDSCPYKKKTMWWRHRESQQGECRVMVEQRVEWLATSRGMVRIAGNHQQPRGGKEGFFQRVFRKTMAPLIPWIQTSGLQNWERINSYSLKPPSLLYFVMKSLGHWCPWCRSSGCCNKIP